MMEALVWHILQPTRKHLKFLVLKRFKEKEANDDWR